MLLCYLEFCDELATYAGTKECKGHYMQRHVNKIHPPKPLRKLSDHSGECQVPGCTRTVNKARLCIPHRKKANRYKLTPDEVIDLPQECAVCGSTESLHIDHDHTCCDTDYTCGKCFRGVLCKQCNLALGNVEDSVERLEKLIDYLKAV